MAEHKGGGGGGGTDIWWFVGFLLVFFILWVSGGGPQRAEQNGSAHPARYRSNTSSPAPATPTNNPSKTPIYVDGKIIY